MFSIEALYIAGMSESPGLGKGHSQLFADERPLYTASETTQMQLIAASRRHPKNRTVNLNLRIAAMVATAGTMPTLM
jgi:hypothetical protein